LAVLIYIPGAMPSFGLNGQPVVATLQFYLNGTLTPATVYSDPALSVPLDQPITSDTSGQFVSIWAPDDGVYSVARGTSDGQANAWDGVSGTTSADAAILAGANAAKVAAVAAQAGAEAAEASAQEILDEIIAQGGDNGWTPVLSLVADSLRIVVAITWTGGDGTPPTSGYLGSSGVVTLIASAVDIRGPSGPGTGDVLATGSPTTGYLATWAGASTIQGTIAYDYSTLPNKPAFGNAVLLNLASQAEALAGTANDKLMTPLRVAEVLAGTSTNIMPGSSKSSNYQLVLNDRGSLITATAAITLSFDSAATLGSGWFAYIYNPTTYDVTVSGTDGLASFVMYPGEFRLFRGDASAITSYVIKGFSKTFTASGTFTKPPGYLDFEGEAWGGGGSGGSNANGGGGGGGGGQTPYRISASAVGTTETVTIGAGGAAATGANGNSGGNTTLGTLVTAYGGAKGIAGSGAAGGGGGGLQAAATTDAGGAPRMTASDNAGFGGADGASLSGAGYNAIYGGAGGGCTSGAGGNSIYGGAGGGAANTSGSADGLGGTSRFGGNGGRGKYNDNGVAGSAPGGGGGATGDATKPSGAGARGELRIRGVA